MHVFVKTHVRSLTICLVILSECSGWALTTYDIKQGVCLWLITGRPSRSTVIVAIKASLRVVFTQGTNMKYVLICLKSLGGWCY